jgi:hypothetical protein
MVVGRIGGKCSQADWDKHESDREDRDDSHVYLWSPVTSRAQLLNIC